jgi:TolA-binding protein
MKKIVFPVLMLTVLFSSCGESQDKVTSVEGEVQSTVTESSKSVAELEKELAEFDKEEELRASELEGKLTTLKFDKLTHDFGNVQREVENTTSFRVTNTGKQPLIISDVSASCGCTTPKKPEKPIAPGKSDVIMVTFKSKPDQLNEIKKSVTVTANTAEKLHVLEIKAFVK